MGISLQGQAVKEVGRIRDPARSTPEVGLVFALILVVRAEPYPRGARPLMNTLGPPTFVVGP